MSDNKKQRAAQLTIACSADEFVETRSYIRNVSNFIRACQQYPGVPAPLNWFRWPAILVFLPALIIIRSARRHTIYNIPLRPLASLEFSVSPSGAVSNACLIDRGLTVSGLGIAEVTRFRSGLIAVSRAEQRDLHAYIAEGTFFAACARTIGGIKIREILNIAGIKIAKYSLPWPLPVPERRPTRASM